MIVLFVAVIATLLIGGVILHECADNYRVQQIGVRIIFVGLITTVCMIVTALWVVAAIEMGWVDTAIVQTALFGEAE